MLSDAELHDVALGAIEAYTTSDLPEKSGFDCLIVSCTHRAFLEHYRPLSAWDNEGSARSYTLHLISLIRFLELALLKQELKQDFELLSIGNSGDPGEWEDPPLDVERVRNALELLTRAVLEDGYAAYYFDELNCAVPQSAVLTDLLHQVHERSCAQTTSADTHGR